MRIGLFTNNYRPLANGLATSVETFAQAFRRAGHAVTVVAPRYECAPDPEPDVPHVDAPDGVILTARSPPHRRHPFSREKSRG